MDSRALTFKADLLELNVAGDGTKLTFWNDFIAGCIGGSAGIVAGYPLDTLKVRQQTTHVVGVPPSVITTATDAFSKEGTRALFRGMTFPLLSEGFRNSLFFGVYGILLGRENYHHHKHVDYVRVFVTAGIAGGVQGVAATPIELIKIQLQLQRGPTTTSVGPFACARHLYAAGGGARALFHGVGITVGREIPALGTYMTTYIFIRRRLTPHGQLDPSLSADLLAGGLAGVASWTLTMPVDVVKSRLQSDGVSRRRYSGVVDCAVRSWRADGPRVFWRGLGVTCLRAFPTNAVTLVVYSKSLAALQKRRHHHHHHPHHQ